MSDIGHLNTCGGQFRTDTFRQLWGEAQHVISDDFFWRGVNGLLRISDALVSRDTSSPHAWLHGVSQPAGSPTRGY